MDWQTLLQLAWEAREHAYAPYSGFRVGAAVETEDGRRFAGANVENLSFGLTLCAERAATVAAITAGAHRIVRVAVVADTTLPVSPCGACRQVLAEFGNPEILLEGRDHAQLRFQLDQLLPRSSSGILDKNG